MRRLTPFFVITVSSSLVTSSNVKPYCRPEQPPPVTNTRCFRSLLPSSSMRAFTLLAALSVKSSGSGMAVVLDMSFISISRDRGSVGGARRGLQLDDLVAFLRAFVHQLAHHDRAHVDLDRFVRDITCDPGLREEFDVLRAPDRPRDGAIDDQMGYIDLALDFCKLRDDQSARFISGGPHVALHVPIDAQPPGKDDVALDESAGADQAVDRAGLVGFSEHGNLPYGWLMVRDSLTCPPGSAKTRTSALLRVAPSGMAKRPSTFW